MNGGLHVSIGDKHFEVPIGTTTWGQVVASYIHTQFTVIIAPPLPEDVALDALAPYRVLGVEAGEGLPLVVSETVAKQTVTFRTWICNAECEADMEKSVDTGLELRSVNVLLIVIPSLTLLVIAGALLLRSFRSRFLDEVDLADELGGWRILRNDVFRQPTMPMLFALILGLGSGALIVTLGLFVLSFLFASLVVATWLWPLFQSMLLLFASFVASLKARESQHLGLMALLVGLAYTIVGCFSWFQELVLFFSELWDFARLGTSTLYMALLLLLFVGAVWVGNYCAKHAKHLIVHPPIKGTNYARLIPPKPLYANFALITLYGGLIPFLSLFAEWGELLPAVFLPNSNFNVVPLMSSLGLAILNTISISVCVIYFLLNAEDYRWQWACFAMGGSCGLLSYLDFLWFGLSQLGLHLQTWDLLLFYLVAAFVVSLLLATGLGTVAYLSGIAFTYTLYSYVKMD